MKNVMKNWRYWLMSAMAVAALLNLVMLPQSNCEHYWAVLIYSKFAAVALAYMVVRLYVWFAKHRQIDELIEFINEGA